MLFKLIYFVIFYITLIYAQSRCRNPIRRPEIRELSRGQLRTLVNAINTIKRSRLEFYDYQSQVHFDSNPYAHGVPAFLPWHREFLYRYEEELKKVDPSIVLPYWDWSIDSQNPENSIIFREDFFGGNGRPEDHCLMDGPFGGWNCTVPDPHCLRRDFDLGNKISAFYSPEALEIVIRESHSYDQFRQRLEAVPHARVHSGIGGKIGDLMTMFSTNDPIFYLHHAFIDLLWHEWQVRNPELASTYDGDRNGTRATVRDTLRPFGISVEEALDTRSGRYCYTYDRFEASIPNLRDGESSNRIQRRLLDNLLGSKVSDFGLITNLLSNTLNTINNVISSTGMTGILSDLGLNLNLDSLIQVSPDDRTTKNKIRITKPTPQKYLEMNHLNVNKVRELEDELNKLVSYLNTIPGFVPKSHLA